MDKELPWLEAQQRIHELIAQQHPLLETLAAISDWIGEMMPGSRVSIMRFTPEDNCLHLVPSTAFSEQFNALMQNIPVADGMGTCGTAACKRELVITDNIQKDPRWDGYHDTARAEGLGACWSMPIVTAGGELLGTFATYYRKPSLPTDGAQKNLARGAALVALAILRHRDAEDHLKLTEWHRALFDNHPDGVYSFDLAGHFQSCNAAMEEMTGFRKEQVLGKHFSQYVDPGYREMTQAAFDKARNGEAITYETVGLHADGYPYHLEIINFPVIIRDEIVGVYGICKNISLRKEQEAKITYQASHDLLTGLPNQARFSEELNGAFSSRACGPVAVMLLNLDGFKPINDGLGHFSGNQVLASVARRLEQSVPDKATLARMVGDEFAVLLPGYTSREEVVRNAENILQVLAQPIEVAGQMVHLSASIGIASSIDPLKHPQELMQYADLALERAKRQGRNTWQWYSGGKAERSRHSVALRHDLHTALQEDQFELWYQPVVDAVSGRMRGVEALVRWHHPQHGLVSPMEFIPLAEQTGQIVPLGRWILNQACKEMAQLNENRERALRVAVNISSLQFNRDGFLQDVRRTLEQTGLQPQLLELEVTESVLLDGAEPVIELMETLKDMGVRVAIDDFGTGFSSLSYLRDLPTHKVKLDRSFVQKTLSDRRMAAIVQGVITMAHHMDMIVVAEGIETREQQDDLARRNCDMLQGYLFARPMPLAELSKLPELLPVASSD